MTRVQAWFASLLIGALVACAPADLPSLPSQTWAGVTVRVEARPTPLQPGMNEFWVILNDERGLPVFDVLVNLRADLAGEWQQAIQDGHTGVFRRAVRVDDPPNATLYVELQRRGAKGELAYRLAAVAQGVRP